MADPPPERAPGPEATSKPAPDPRTLPPLPAAVELPANPACSYGTKVFRGAHGVTSIHLRQGGPAFAQLLDAAAAEIGVPAGKASGVGVEIRSVGYVIRGFVDAEAIALSPLVPFAMSDLAAPWPKTKLSYTEASSGEITVTLAAPTALLVKGGKLVAKRPCGDLGMDVSTFDVASVMLGKRPHQRMSLSRGAAVIAGSPGGVAIATFLSPNDGTIVQGYETSGSQRLIQLDLQETMVFGWVSSARLTEANGGSGTSSSIGIGRSRRKGPKPAARVICAADLPLIAELKKESATIGVISAGSTIDVIEWGIDRSPVGVDGSAVHPESGVRFLTRTAELEACTPAPPKSP